MAYYKVIIWLNVVMFTWAVMDTSSLQVKIDRVTKRAVPICEEYHDAVNGGKVR